MSPRSILRATSPASPVLSAPTPKKRNSFSPRAPCSPTATRSLSGVRGCPNRWAFLPRSGGPSIPIRANSSVSFPISGRETRPNLSCTDRRKRNASPSPLPPSARRSFSTRAKRSDARQAPRPGETRPSGKSVRRPPQKRRPQKNTSPPRTRASAFVAPTFWGARSEEAYLTISDAPSRRRERKSPPK